MREGCAGREAFRAVRSGDRNEAKAEPVAARPLCKAKICVAGTPIFILDLFKGEK